MLNLIPANTYDYEQLWTLIRSRNTWFIKLRYIAFFSLILFLLSAQFVLNLKFKSGQFLILVLISFSILVYNLILYSITKSTILQNDPNKFNPMSLSLIQIGLDILALFLLSYYTGGIESPLYMFFIFHMIIGSMILPGYIIYMVSGVIVFCFFAFSFLEYFAVIPHYAIEGFTKIAYYNDLNYILIFATAFGIMIFVSVFFTNTIASSLYRSEQELKVTLDKLDEAEKVKQKYTMGIVHEIKSPIVAVQSYLDIILGKYVGPVSSQVEDKIKKARHRTEESINIINDVLNISRIKLLDKIPKEEFDLKKLILDNIEKRKAQAENKNIDVKFYDKHPENENYNGDKSLIDLAFSNLLGNAIKYTNDGGKVEIIINKNEGKTNIEVCDNGVGIPGKDQNKIFRDFYRASNVKDSAYDGTGLGLSVVKQIVEQHGGTVSFQSPSRLADIHGVGTSFLIQL
jgi:signal transduction histidine kinase